LNAAPDLIDDNIFKTTLDAAVRIVKRAGNNSADRVDPQVAEKIIPLAIIAFRELNNHISCSRTSGNGRHALDDAAEAMYENLIAILQLATSGATGPPGNCRVSLGKMLDRHQALLNTQGATAASILDVENAASNSRPHHPQPFTVEPSDDSNDPSPLPTSPPLDQPFIDDDDSHDKNRADINAALQRKLTAWGRNKFRALVSFLKRESNIDRSTVPMGAAFSKLPIHFDFSTTFTSVAARVAPTDNQAKTFITNDSYKSPIDDDYWRVALKHYCDKRSGAGPSGICARALTDILNVDAASDSKSGGELNREYTRFLDNMLFGYAPTLAFTSALSAIEKTPGGGADDARFIAAPEVFHQVVGRTVAKHIAAMDKTPKHDYTLRSNGNAYVVHAITNALTCNPNQIMISLDCKNAFNTVDRYRVLTAYYAKYQCFYWYKRRELLAWSPRVSRDGSFAMATAVGVIQGTATSSLDLSLVVDIVVEETRRQWLSATTTEPVEIFTVADDIRFLVKDGREADAFSYIATFIKNLQELAGLSINPAKCCIVTNHGVFLDRTRYPLHTQACLAAIQTEKIRILTTAAQADTMFTNWQFKNVLDVTTDPLKVLGTILDPTNSTDHKFIEKISDKFHKTFRLCDTIDRYLAHDPVLAIHALRVLVLTRHDYTNRTMWPNQTYDKLLLELDNRVYKSFARALRCTPEFLDSIMKSSHNDNGSRESHARILYQLPTVMGGFGIRSRTKLRYLSLYSALKHSILNDPSDLPALQQRFGDLLKSHYAHAPMLETVSALNVTSQKGLTTALVDLPLKTAYEHHYMSPEKAKDSLDVLARSRAFVTAMPWPYSNNAAVTPTEAITVYRYRLGYIANFTPGRACAMHAFCSTTTPDNEHLRLCREARQRQPRAFTTLHDDINAHICKYLYDAGYRDNGMMIEIIGEPSLEELSITRELQLEPQAANRDSKRMDLVYANHLGQRSAIDVSLVSSTSMNEFKQNASIRIKEKHSEYDALLNNNNIDAANNFHPLIIDCAGFLHDDALKTLKRLHEDAPTVGFARSESVPYRLIEPIMLMLMRAQAVNILKTTSRISLNKWTTARSRPRSRARAV
jgi:hypothetical protein